MPLRLNRNQLLDLIESIEADNGDATALRHELEELGPDQDSRTRTRRQGSRFKNEEEPTLVERLNYEVGDLFDGGVSDELEARCIDMDRDYSTKELQAMCKEAGLSPNGHKKKLAAKLIAHGQPEDPGKYIGGGI